MPKDLSNTFKEVKSNILAGKDSDRAVEKEVSESSALDLLTSHAKNKSPVTSTKEKNVISSSLLKSPEPAIRGKAPMFGSGLLKKMQVDLPSLDEKP